MRVSSGVFGSVCVCVCVVCVSIVHVVTTSKNICGIEVNVTMGTRRFVYLYNNSFSMGHSIILDFRKCFQWVWQVHSLTDPIKMNFEYMQYQ